MHKSALARCSLNTVMELAKTLSEDAKAHVRRHGFGAMLDFTLAQLESRELIMWLMDRYVEGIMPGDEIWRPKHSDIQTKFNSLTPQNKQNYSQVQSTYPSKLPKLSF